MEMVEDSQEYQLSRLKQAQAQKEANLEFFKEFHPGIYNRFSGYVLQKYKVSLNTEIDQLDILTNNKSIYNDHPIKEAKESLHEFQSNFSQGKFLRTIQPPFKGYDYPRFFHKSCSSLINKSPLKSSDYKGYKIPDFYPLIIFNGVGAGYHISEFIKDYIVINCLIVEEDEDLFACSLYTTDWKKICKPFLENTERCIHFIIGPFEEEKFLSAFIMKYLSAHCPLYPLTTLFINHNNKKSYREATKKINEDTHAFVSVWGFYDDEINQINNTLHNINLNTPIIRSNKSNLRELPIFIIGAGPSLDDRIDVIRENKEKALIISCGTSLHTLYHYGVKPDIHFELESHQITLKSLRELGDDDWLKSIPIMGPAQLTPTLYDFFPKKVIYFKGESITSMLFGNEKNSVNRGTPTCTNGALALFSHWGFKNICLFGMDFGYRDLSSHHAKGSIYYTSKDEDIARDAKVELDAKITVEAVDGSIIKTKPLLYTAKRTAETTAKSFQKFCTFYNCSNGAKMDGTTWIESGIPPIEFKNEYRDLKEEFLKIQYENDNVIELNIVNERLKVLDHNLGEIYNYLKNQVKGIKNNLYSLTSGINNITSFLENKMRNELPPFYFFIRGSLWHLFYIGYSHALCIENNEDLEKWIDTWKTDSIETIKKMRKHYQKIVFKDFNINTDLWVHRSASDPED